MVYRSDPVQHENMLKVFLHRVLGVKHVIMHYKQGIRRPLLDGLTAASAVHI